MSQHAAPAAKAPVERKVWWSSLATFAASVAVALLAALLGSPSMLETLPGWASFVVIAVGPTVVQFLAGYAAPHTARTDPAALEQARRAEPRR